jgi:hypothetical protein
MTILYNSNYDLTIPQSDTCAQVALQANTEQTFTLPGTAINNYSVRFTYISTSNVFVRFNGVPTIPAGGSVGTEQYNEFRPGCDGSQRYAKGGDVIDLNGIY